MEVIAIPRSASLTTAAASFIAEVEDWLRHCVETYGEAPALDVHDQGTYVTSWLPVLQARPQPAVTSFLKTTRDRIAAHFAAAGQWHHGYWKRHEIHHGTEHFELFLGMLGRLDPDDGETVRQVVDAAEHFGNWVTGIPAWYDWERRRFMSMYFGSESVGSPVKNPDDAPESLPGLNVPDHFRAINILLLAWQLTGDPRYLDLARQAAQPWVDGILRSGELPAALDRNGPLYDIAENPTYRGFAGMAPTSSAQIDRAENLLASGAPNAFLRLLEVTGEPDYQAAAERIIDVLGPQLIDPDAGAAVDIIRQFRLTTNDNRYDERLKVAMSTADPFGFDTLGIALPDVQRRSRPQGVGKRGDKPNWFEDAKARRHSPVLLAHVAERSGDDELAARALDLGRAYFNLARRVFKDGREHGCSARSVSAIARGHGRENHTGVITGVLAPILKAFALEEA